MLQIVKNNQKYLQQLDMSSTQQKKQQDSPITISKTSKNLVGISRSPYKSVEKKISNQATKQQTEQQDQNKEFKEDDQFDNQSDLSVEKKGVDKKQKISLQEQQRRRLGEQAFLHKQHKFKIILQSLGLNQYKCFPYETRYTPKKTGIFDDYINEETQKENQKQPQERAQSNQKSLPNDKNKNKESKQVIKQTEKSLSRYCEQIQEKLGYFEMRNDGNQGYDEFMDQVW